MLFRWTLIIVFTQLLVFFCLVILFKVADTCDRIFNERTERFVKHDNVCTTRNM